MRGLAEGRKTMAKVAARTLARPCAMRYESSAASGGNPAWVAMPQAPSSLRMARSPSFNSGMDDVVDALDDG